MNNKKSMKAIVLSIVLAAMLLPMTGKAQSYNDGTAESHNSSAFYELIAYDTYLDELANALRAIEFNNRSGGTFGITNNGIGQSEAAPLGSGIAILIGAGLGYVALKKKEDEQ